MMQKWGSGKREDHLAWTIMALPFERRSLIIYVDFERRILNIFHVNRRWYFAPMAASGRPWTFCFLDRVSLSATSFSRNITPGIWNLVRW